MNPNLKREKLILNISFVGSIAFLLAEILVAIITNSNAVFMDCVYDIADLIMIGPFLVLIPLLYKPETEKRPYGFSQIESLFILLKSGVLIGVTCFLIFDSLQTILSGGNEVDASVVAIFELLVSLTCVIMYFVLSKLSKKYTSPSIKAELYIWKLDSLSTLGVGVAFLIKLLLDRTDFSFIGPYIDPGIAIILAVLLLKEPIGLFVESLKNLVLFAPDSETSAKIRKICNKHMEKYNCYINFLDVIKTGRKIWVEIYFVIEKDLISIAKLKCLHKEILDDLSSEFDSLYVELIPDVEDVNPDNLIKMKSARRPDKINYISKKNDKKNSTKKEKLKIKEIKKSY
ncbi:MAG: cation diffusion facilitator family transporter [Bacilli bacterium]